MTSETASERLSLATLIRLAGTSASVTLPAIDPAGLSIGIVHLGIGAFHRAHQAVFTEDAAAAAGETNWGILGVTGRSESVVDQLRPQDCLYGVLQKGAEHTSLRVVGSVREVAWPGRDSQLVVETLARPTTHIATLTITEKGYLRAADGRIDLDLPAVQHDRDLVNSELRGEPRLHGDEAFPASHTPIGLLVRGLARRFRENARPFTLLSCDNLVDNGSVTGAVVGSLVAALEPSTTRDEFEAWLKASVTFPSSMVDRISPATTDADRAEAAQLLGLGDAALVVAEPFIQWVIEDNFGGPRPAWEKAGAILTTDVSPYERTKLRILNSTHSLLAYLGALKGYATIAQAIADPVLRAAARCVIDEDILPTLETPPGLDLAEYSDSVLERFTNPNLPHTTVQVAMDGSQKLPTRILGTVVDCLAAAHTPEGLALTVAAWITFVVSTLTVHGTRLDDPLAELLQKTAARADAIAEDPVGLVERFLALEQIFPADVRESAAFRDAIVRQLGRVQELIAAS
ncbi:mannitol dehydrogenase family protein [Cryobacterium psychrophilum]|uniref:Mannitol-1-phosphate 5-dehydrogenase n=1 Tax=Cryobacterium psychrophilum TaxID=41988 RepID=A0A4Y8KQB3_9MICO|nr:mannitol dehydrogenase family protein [Cryobacterium psychrophilum]TDW30582.1 fructuronate reductase [Cryobacterium psychrophilum]TFD80201.1 mannitol dehydrogenase family protein [Cryobacterium psychrophilum]